MPDAAATKIENSAISAPHPFLTPSIAKLAAYSVLSLGVYTLYWFYKNWQAINDRSEKKVIPWLRATLAPFYAASCFQEIKNLAQKEGVPCRAHPEFLGTIFCLLFLLQLVPYVKPLKPLPWLLLSLLSFLPLIPFNKVLFECVKKTNPGYRYNNQVSGWLVASVVLIIFAMIALFWAASALISLDAIE